MDGYLTIDDAPESIIDAQHISEKTVEKHLEKIFAKLGVTSRLEAAVHAVRQSLV